MNQFQQSESLTELAPALARAQAAGLIAIERTDNKQVASKYADFVSIVTAIRPILAAEGLAFAQTIGGVRKEGEHYVIGLRTMLLHTSGQYLADYGEFIIQFIISKASGTAVSMTWASASAVTYLRRYCLCSILGIVTGGDDDAQRFAETVTATATAASAPSADSDFTAFLGGLWRDQLGPDGRKLGDYKNADIVALVDKCIKEGEEIEALKAWIFDRMERTAKAAGEDLVPALKARSWLGTVDFDSWKLDDFRTAGMLLSGAKPQGEPQP